ncbi:MAG: hypothetical protein JKY15_05560 [Deltaproteobacteria bacterium]|nr:hypothetical protein [Deltaproteobacteria bacterium]
MIKYIYQTAVFCFFIIVLSVCGSKGSSSVSSADALTADAAETPEESGSEEASVFTEQADIYTGTDASETIIGLGGGDTIDVGTGTDTIAYSVAGQTFNGTVISGVTVLTGIDVISGMSLGDKISFYPEATVSFTTSLQTTLLSSPSISDVIAVVRGVYDSSTGIFTAGGTATDTLVQWNTKGITSTGQTESAVMKGYLASNPATRDRNIIILR